jgi:hypothetical protein
MPLHSLLLVTCLTFIFFAIFKTLAHLYTVQYFLLMGGGRGGERMANIYTKFVCGKYFDDTASSMVCIAGVALIIIIIHVQIRVCLVYILRT